MIPSVGPLIAHRATSVGPTGVASVLPKAPVLDWGGFWRNNAPVPTGIANLPHWAYTSSGRAALHAALLQMNLPPGSAVLVPTYHCPTMVAPIVAAGHTPVFYGLHDDGRPRLDAIDANAVRPRAMFVAHYFGLASSLSAVKRWCDLHDVLLVEDCAHSYFGMAGDRPVGSWGDYAITSLSKFFPMPEGGLLASASHRLAPINLKPTRWRQEIKAVWDVLHRAHDHGRMRVLSGAVGGLVALRRRTLATAEPLQPLDHAARSQHSIIEGCDMGRIHEKPTHVAQWIHRNMTAAFIVAARRKNFAQYVEQLAGASGARVLQAVIPEGGAPYVVPLWVDGPDRADKIYASMRAARLPVFRWDQVWPETPTIDGDAGQLWRTQVLQILCHQSLDTKDVAYVASATRTMLENTQPDGGVSPRDTF